MAHIVCITTGLTGIVHASFEVVSRLKAAGHRVTYACPVDIRNKVEAQGFEFVQLREVNFDPAPELPAITGRNKSMRRVWRFFTEFRSRRRAAVEALGMDAFGTTLRSLAPDLVLLDMELHDHVITTKAMGVPLLLLDQFFCSWRRPYLPPIYSRIVPGEGRWGHRLGIALYWQRRVMKSWYAMIRSSIKNGFVDRRSILRAYARKVGFPLRELEQHYWPPPFTYRTFPVLSMTCRRLDFPHRERADFHYVGPMVSVDRIDPDAAPELTEDLREIFLEVSKEGKSLIYCVISTMGDSDLNFHRQLVDAVGERNDWLLLIGLGGKNKPEDLAPLPANVRVFPWLPQLEILRRCHCAIHHGGIHTINECLHFQVPMLVYSGGQHDQMGNAARISYHGIGMIGDRQTDDASRIRQRIQHILEDTRMRERMKAVSDQCCSPEEHGRLVRIVEETIERNPERAGCSSVA